MKVCDYCNQPIKDDEAKVYENGGWYHLHCAAEEADGNDLTNEMSSD